MSNESKRLLDPRVLGADDTQDVKDAYDAGAFDKLEIQARFLKSGSAGNLILQHAAVNEEDSYISLGTASWATTGSGGHISISNFLRFIRWKADGSVAGTPVAMIDIIAKR